MSSWPTEAFFCRAALLLKKLEAHLHAKFSSIQATITSLSPPLLCLVLLFNTDQLLEELLQVLNVLHICIHLIYFDVI